MKKLMTVFLSIATALSIIPTYAEDTETSFTPGFIESEYAEITVESDSPQPLLFPVESYGVSESEDVILPDKFDARETGKIHFSGIGQWTDGTCWSFASALATETALGGTVNISEQHIRYACSNEGNNMYGYIRSPSSGGNFSMYTAYAAAWRGPVLEKDDPYIYGSEARDYATVTAQKPVAYHLQGTIEVPNPSSDPKNVTASEKAKFLQTVKKYIYKYNCCFSSIHWDSAYYNSETCAYFNPSVYSLNHAINLIGWDDNYPKENFKTSPQNDGAFIVKNSQGKTGGYLYLSYEDAMAGWNSSVVTSIEDRFNYGDVYTYDHFEPGAALTAYPLAKTTNVYKSRYDGEFVSAVGVVTKSSDLDYKVYISNLGNGNEKTELLYTLCASGTLEMPGFHTIKLSSPFSLGNKGTRYCVRVVYTSDKSFSVPLEYKTGTIPDTYANPGESFYSTSSFTYDTYDDIMDGNGNAIKANLYVKAYTDAKYSISFCGCEDGSFCVNGGEFTSCTNTTAGLNDEITLDFKDYEAFFINGTEYSTDNPVTIKLTKDIEISTLKEVNKSTVSGEETLKVKTITQKNDEYILDLSAEFNRNHIVYAAIYNGNTLTGITPFYANADTGDFSLPIYFENGADHIKVIICDSVSTLSTSFKVLEITL